MDRQWLETVIALLLLAFVSCLGILMLSGMDSGRMLGIVIGVVLLAGVGFLAARKRRE